MTAVQNSPGESLMERLRSETREVHARVESLPFFEALWRGSLAIESFVGLLRAFAVVHASIERELGASGDAVVRAVWREEQRKLPLLEEDLQFFEPRRFPDVPEAAERAVAMTERIRQRVLRLPASLLGYAYVFEGSLRGAPTIRSWAENAFQLEQSKGLVYFSRSDERTLEQWWAFGRRMDRTVSDPALREAIVNAAQECFEGIENVVRALHPIDRDELRPVATTLNPEAGRHPVPGDPAELEAALRAGERTRNRLPYFDFRYGERGKRFTDSDSAWLATLVQLDRPIVNDQIQWLARVLAARGIPRWAMEIHLDLLFAELSEARPGKAEEYEKLARAADILRNQRLQRFDEETFRAIGREFDAEAPPGWVEKLPDTGLLVAAAVADEKEGLHRVTDSLIGWLTDPDRFPPAWIAAVEYTLEKAHRFCL